MLADDLGRHVAWCATENLEALVVGDNDTEAKVDELDHASAFFNQDVIKLDVSVDGINAMEVCY